MIDSTYTVLSYSYKKSSESESNLRKRTCPIAEGEEHMQKYSQYAEVSPTTSS